MNTSSTTGARLSAAQEPRIPIARIRVWDPLVRIGHWLLVAGFFVAYVVGDEPLDLHVWAGYLVGAVVLIRIVWGVVGTRHARFREFIFSPKTALIYLRDLLRGSARRYIGHSPAGGAMVLMLLTSLAATTWTGIMVYAYEEQAGPMARYVADGEAFPLPDLTVIPSAVADDEYEEHDERFEEREEFWEEGHEFFANFTLVLIVLHVTGVLLASFVHRENLIVAMITGHKRPGEYLVDRGPARRASR